MNDLVSIIMPSYNTAAYIKQSIESVLSCVQLGTLNAYLYVKYVVKNHRRPRRIPQEEAEAFVKELFEKYKDQINE